MDKPQAKVAGERYLAERTGKADARLRERRLARKLTQETLAKELGVTANTIARWERYEMPLPHWVIPHLALQRQVAELTSALAEKDEAQKKLRETIKAMAARKIKKPPEGKSLRSAVSRRGRETAPASS